MAGKSTRESFAEYMPHIRRRWEREQAGWQERRARAWEDARRAAALLRDEFGAQRVIAFGSLVQSGLYDERSDIDLAVAGISARQFFRASARAASVCDRELDLIDLADCPPSLREQIEEEGVPL